MSAFDLNPLLSQLGGSVRWALDGLGPVAVLVMGLILAAAMLEWGVNLVNGFRSAGADEEE
jgi:hypothetical protein